MATKRYGPVTIKETGDIENTLAKLPKEIASGPVLGRSLAAAGKVVIKNSKPRVPRGDPKHNPEKIALWKTLAVVKREYDGGKKQMGVVGPSFPAGAHGHLVEFGHDITRTKKRAPRKGMMWVAPPTLGYVEGKEFLAPAARATSKQQEKAIVDHIVKEIKKHGG